MFLLKIYCINIFHICYYVDMHFIIAYARKYDCRLVEYVFPQNCQINRFKVPSPMAALQHQYKNTFSTHVSTYAGHKVNKQVAGHKSRFQVCCKQKCIRPLLSERVLGNCISEKRKQNGNQTICNKLVHISQSKFLNDKSHKFIIVYIH